MRQFKVSTEVNGCMNSVLNAVADVNRVEGIRSNVDKSKRG